VAVGDPVRRLEHGGLIVLGQHDREAHPERSLGLSLRALERLSVRRQVAQEARVASGSSSIAWSSSRCTVGSARLRGANSSSRSMSPKSTGSSGIPIERPSRKGRSRRRMGPDSLVLHQPSPASGDGTGGRVALLLRRGAGAISTLGCLRTRSFARLRTAVERASHMQCQH
jgi:hypothetical protein